MDQADWFKTGPAKGKKEPGARAGGLVRTLVGARVAARVKPGSGAGQCSESPSDSTSPTRQRPHDLQRAPTVILGEAVPTTGNKKDDAKAAERRRRARAALVSGGNKGVCARYWVIDPRTSHWMSYWDLATASALIFTAVVTPFEVGFLPTAQSMAEALFLINRLVDFLFFFDGVFQFRLCYSEKTVTEGVFWVDDARSIAMHYLTSWFLVDGGHSARGGSAWWTQYRRGSSGGLRRLRRLHFRLAPLHARRAGGRGRGPRRPQDRARRSRLPVAAAVS